MKNNMINNNNNQSCAFITITMPDGTKYAGMIPQVGFEAGAVPRTHDIHITSENSPVIHPAMQEKKGVVKNADPATAAPKASKAIDVNLTFQNMLYLVTAFSAYHNLDLHVGEMRYEGFWKDILSGLERLGEVICDISPLYKVFEETFGENRIFEDILWVEEIGLEEKARMLMGFCDNDGDSDAGTENHAEADGE